VEGGGGEGALSATLRLDGVSFSYGAVAALADVSFALAAGERAALLGRNGAGKSTLVKLVTGLVRPAAGTVWVGDWDTKDRTPEALARRVGSVFQHADQQLFARTLREDVSFGPRALGVPEPDTARRVARALGALELEPHAGEHPYDLPPALRKLAALAGALALEPALLLLDEPTAGLDRALRARVTRALLERSAAGVALLVITHDLTFAAETLERGLVLDRGRLACDEPLAGLLGSAGRLEPFGLVPPAVAALSAALGLPGRPVRAADAARALARVAGGRAAP
jgi:energy-coupling factor transport system ATP-binding protein